MHYTTDEMLKMFKDAEKIAPIGTSWRHYKGGLYLITDHSLCTETAQMQVLYKRIDGEEFDIKEYGVLFCRPLSQWKSPKFERE